MQLLRFFSCFLPLFHVHGCDVEGFIIEPLLCAASSLNFSNKAATCAHLPRALGTLTHCYFNISTNVTNNKINIQQQHVFHRMLHMCMYIKFMSDIFDKSTTANFCKFQHISTYFCPSLMVLL